jgi:hypothetical protein
MAELFTAVCWLVIALLSRPFPLTTLLLLVVAEVDKVFQEMVKEVAVVQVDFALQLLQLVVEVL